MRVEIDENSGFCTGVVNAICKAEEELKKDAFTASGTSCITAGKWSVYSRKA